MKTQYRNNPRKTSRPDQAHRLLKFMSQQEKRLYSKALQEISTDPLLKL